MAGVLMPDISLDQAKQALNAGIAAGSSLELDRLAYGNREASFTKSHRAYRVNDTGFVDTELYRNRDRMRIDDAFTLHLIHRTSNKLGPQTGEALARADATALVQALYSSADLAELGIRVTLEDISAAESDSGDHIETDVDITLQYDLALAVGVA